MENDPILALLNTPAGELKEPTFPVLAEGPYRMEVRSFELIKSESGSNRISIKLATTQDAKSVEKTTLHKGFSFAAPVFLDPNENTTAQQIAEQAAMPVKAVLGAKTKVTVKECLDNPSLVVGKPVDVLIGVREGKKEYSGTFSNTIKKWVIPQ